MTIRIASPAMVENNYEVANSSRGCIGVDYAGSIERHGKRVFETEPSSGEQWLLWPEEGYGDNPRTGSYDIVLVAISWTDEATPYYTSGDTTASWENDLALYNEFVNSFADGAFEYLLFNVHDPWEGIKPHSASFPQHVHEHDVSRDPVKEDFINPYEALVGDMTVGSLVLTVDDSGSMGNKIQPAYDGFVDYLRGDKYKAYRLYANSTENRLEIGEYVNV